MKYTILVWLVISLTGCGTTFKLSDKASITLGDDGSGIYPSKEFHDWATSGEERPDKKK